MSWIDWLIVIVPVSFVFAIGWRSRRYVRGVVDFLSAGRLCGRYVISMGDLAQAFSIIGLVAFVEVNYKAGMAVGFWGAFVALLHLLLALTGYCLYRFRETKALSLGQFLEMRYSRSFRIFASALRTVSEILANMIMPAIAARFFIYFFGLPATFSVLGFSFSTFTAVMLVCLILAISLICMGGTLTLVITDAIQGMICYPIMAIFAIFLLTRFSWYGEVVPTLLNRVEGQSFLNPFDVHRLRDFNLFMMVMWMFIAVWHRASWLGAGASTAAKSPNEQKIANILGTFRNLIMNVLYAVIGVSIIVLLNQRDLAPQARAVRMEIAEKVSADIVNDPATRGRMLSRMAAMDTSAESYRDPLSDERNNDTPWLNAAHETLLEEEAGLASGEANALFQQFRTLYHQVMLAVSMRHMLPPVILGLFCLMMILAMISTDNSRIFSASLTLTQDLILPFRKKGFTPRQHIRALQLSSIGVGVIFLIGSTHMAQLDYILMFTTLMTMMWMSGCGPVMIFGLYSRFGTTAGAFASLGTGMGLALGNIFLQQHWAARVYPWLERMGWVERVGAFLEAASRPFHPIVVWRMDAVRFPINTFESYVLSMLITLIVYCVVSWATRKTPFNLDRMLHRGIYNTDGDIKERMKWTVRNAFSQIIGITPAYTRGDKAIAWGTFGYSFLYGFCLIFLVPILWNAISPWPAHWWGTYQLITVLIVPGALAVFFAFLFLIGGVRDMRQLFRDLRSRSADPLDDGTVDGHVSTADKKRFETLEGQARSNRE